MRRGLIAALATAGLIAAVSAAARLLITSSFLPDYAGLGRARRFHEPSGGDAELAAGLDDGGAGGAVEQAQDQVVGGEHQCAEVDDSVAG